MNSMNAKITKNIKVATRENTPRIKEGFKLSTTIVAFLEVLKDMVNSPTVNIDEKECKWQDFVELGMDRESAKELSKGIDAEGILELQEVTKKKVENITHKIIKNTKQETRENISQIKELDEEELDR